MKKNSSKQNPITRRTVLSAVLLLVVAALIWFAVSRIQDSEEFDELYPGDFETMSDSSEQETEEELSMFRDIELSDGLVIRHISGYAGIYMEDGSGDVVTDVMMLVLENTAAKDLQLARIYIEYSDFTAEFEVTNIPAGEKVVALEKNRHPETAEVYQSVRTANVVFYPTAMELQEERIRINGANGSLELENISGEDITQDIYVYYKNSASDLLYGGITYRVSIKGGLNAGEKSRVIAGHYTTDGCRILLVDCGD
jgi:hypothetical protein